MRGLPGTLLIVVAVAAGGAVSGLLDNKAAVEPDTDDAALACRRGNGHAIYHLPHPSDCQRFYKCDHGAPIEYSCPPGLHFNPLIHVCDYPDRANCQAGPVLTPCHPTNPCQHEGSCTETATGGYECSCVNGYTGFDCELGPVFHPCHPTNPCQHEGSCTETAAGGYGCSCVNGYTGVNCETGPVLNPCHPTNPCQHEGYCTETATGGYGCSCVNGYTGVSCEVGPVLNPCHPINPCQHEGSCTETATGGYGCSCVDGYTGVNCEVGPVLNPCHPTNPCQNEGSCSQTATGGYECSCVSGYTGVNCENSPCASDPCSPGVCYATLAMTTSGYVCMCPGQLTLGGTSCTDTVTPSSSCTPNPCQNNGVCNVQLGGSYSCACPTGFTGHHCEITPSTSCTPNPCQNNGVCNVQLSGSYSCVCPTGFTGHHCETPPTSCSPNTCQNSGVCNVLPSGDYSCMCHVAFTGYRCETQLTLCTPNPCQNNGVCNIQPNGDYSCVCPIDFTGYHCENPPTSCTPSPCINSGVCRVRPGGNYSCACPTGFSGLHCEMSPCGSNPCYPGTCYASPSLTLTGYVCMCPGQASPGGTSCHDTVCSQVPGICNGGKCIAVDSVTEPLVCDCTGTGYTGRFCQNAIDACASNPCQNAGACQNSAHGYSCTCWQGYTGTRCEQVINPCASAPCHNSGVCHVTAHGYSCTCQQGYTGTRCENATLTNDAACQGRQPFPCPADVAYFTYPDYDNPVCNTFYQCRRGSLVKRWCPAGFLYNSATLRCQREDGDPLKFFCDRVKAAFSQL